MPLNDGQVATGAQAITVELDIDKAGTFEVICANGFDESLNLNIESYVTLCNGGLTSNAITGQDIEWSTEIVVAKGSPTAKILNNRYDIQALNDIPMKITNELLGTVTEINIIIASLEMTAQGDELVKASMTFKPYDEMPVVVPIVVPSP